MYVEVKLEVIESVRLKLLTKGKFGVNKKVIVTLLLFYSLTIDCLAMAMSF